MCLTFAKQDREAKKTRADGKGVSDSKKEKEAEKPNTTIHNLSQSDVGLA